MKKQYMKPAIKVYQVKMTHIICVSGDDLPPVIPGPGDDDQF